ncbi:hypothetical protein T439DRAFT_330625 [Meredithblackwellia eburnea MCA 4105]
MSGSWPPLLMPRPMKPWVEPADGKMDSNAWYVPHPYLQKPLKRHLPASAPPSLKPAPPPGPKKWVLLSDYTAYSATISSAKAGQVERTESSIISTSSPAVGPSTIHPNPNSTTSGTWKAQPHSSSTEIFRGSFSPNPVAPPPPYGEREIPILIHTPPPRPPTIPPRYTSPRPSGVLPQPIPQSSRPPRKEQPLPRPASTAPSPPIPTPGLRLGSPLSQRPMNMPPLSAPKPIARLPSPPTRAQSPPPQIVRRSSPPSSQSPRNSTLTSINKSRTSIPTPLPPVHKPPLPNIPSPSPASPMAVRPMSPSPRPSPRAPPTADRPAPKMSSLAHPPSPSRRVIHPPPREWDAFFDPKNQCYLKGDPTRLWHPKYECYIPTWIISPDGTGRYKDFATLPPFPWPRQPPPIIPFPSTGRTPSPGTRPSLSPGSSRGPPSPSPPPRPHSVDSISKPLLRHDTPLSAQAPPRHVLTDPRSRYYREPRQVTPNFRLHTRLNQPKTDYKNCGLRYYHERQQDNRRPRASNLLLIAEDGIRQASKMFILTVGLIQDCRDSWMQEQGIPLGVSPMRSPILTGHLQGTMKMGTSLLAYWQATSQAAELQRPDEEVEKHHVRMAKQMGMLIRGATALMTIFNKFAEQEAGKLQAGFLCLMQAIEDIKEHQHAIIAESESFFSLRLLRHSRDPNPAARETSHHCRQMIEVRRGAWRAFQKRAWQVQDEVHLVLEELLHWSYLERLVTEEMFVKHAWHLFQTLRIDLHSQRPVFHDKSVLRRMWPESLCRYPSPGSSTSSGPIQLRSTSGVLRDPSPPGTFDRRSQKAQIEREMGRPGQGRHARFAT